MEKLDFFGDGKCVYFKVKGVGGVVIVPGQVALRSRRGPEIRESIHNARDGKKIWCYN